MPATKNPFEYNESYLIEATLFDEFAEEEETAIAKLSGIPLPTWEEPQDTQHRKRKRSCRAGKKKQREFESFLRADGRRVYYL